MSTGNAKVKTKEVKAKPLGQQIIDAWNTRTDEIIFPFYTHDYVVEDISAGRIREGYEGLRQWTKKCFYCLSQPSLYIGGPR